MGVLAVKKISPKDRLKLLKLAESLGSVSDACAKVGVDRTSFYKWKRRYEAEGMRGLSDKHPAMRPDLRKFTDEDFDVVLRMAVEHPAWGCKRLEQELRASGLSISSPTIQSQLASRGLAFEDERILRLEQGEILPPADFSHEQHRLIASLKGDFLDPLHVRQVGDLVVQEVTELDRLANGQRIFLHAAFDVATAYIFAGCFLDRSADACLTLWKRRVLPSYGRWGARIKCVISDPRAYRLGENATDFISMLQSRGIHRVLGTHRQRWLHGLFQSFYLKEGRKLAAVITEQRHAEDIEPLAKIVDTWERRCNDSPQLSFGFPGKRPVDAIKERIATDSV